MAPLQTHQLQIVVRCCWVSARMLDLVHRNSITSHHIVGGQGSSDTKFSLAIKQAWGAGSRVFLRRVAMASLWNAFVLVSFALSLIFVFGFVCSW